MVHSFARNIRDAGNAVRIAQLQSQAAAVRQQAQLLRTNSAIAQQIRTMQTHATGLDRQARGYTLAAAQAREYRDTVLRANGATNQQVATVNDSIRTFERRAAVLRSQASLERNAIQSMTNGLDDQVRVLNTHASALENEARRLRDADRVALDHARSLRHLSVGFQQASDVALGFSFALGAASAAGGIFIAKAVKATVDYEKQVRLTATQVDKFAGNLKELGNVGIRIASQIGVSFQEVQPALFDIFSSMEVGVADAEKLLKAFAKGAVAGQVEIQDVSRATIGLMNAFNRPVSDVNKLLDIQFQLVQEGIGTYEEWNQRIGLVTPSAVRAGQSVEVMAAALAASTRMGLSAARSGTAVARAMDAMSHPAAVKNMEELGIKVRDAHGKFLPMNVVLRQFRDVLNKMPEKDRVKAILDVFKGAGGTIEARRFLQNMLLGKQNIELFDQVLQEMQNTSGSMEKAYSTMADSIAVKTELLKNKWQILKIGVGEALVPSVLQLVDALSKALDWFNRLPDSTKNIISQFILWGTAAAGIGAIMFGFVAIIGFVVAAFATAGTTILIVVGVLGGLAVAAIAAGAAFLTLWHNSDNFRKLISDIGSNVNDAKNVIVELAQRGAAAFNDKLGPALKDLWNTVETKVIPVINDFSNRVSNNLLPKLQEAGDVFINRIKPAMDQVASFIKGDLIPALNDLAATYEKNKGLIDPIVKGLGMLAVMAAFVGGSILAGLVVPLKLIGIVIQAGIAWIGLVISFFRNLDDAARAVGSALQTAWGAVSSFFSGVASAVGSFVMGVVNWFTRLPGMIGSALAALPGIIKGVWQTAVDAVFYTVGFMIGMVVSLLTVWPAKIFSTIIDIVPKIASVFMNAATQAMRWTTSMVTGVISFLFTLPGKATSAIIGIISSIVNIFSRATTSAGNGAKSIVDKAISFVKQLPPKIGQALNEIPGKVTSALSSAANAAFNGGRRIVESVVNGVGSLVGWAAGQLKRAAGNIVKGFLDALPGSPVKWGPLKVLNNGKMGRKIIRMIVDGMNKETSTLGNAFASIVPNPLVNEPMFPRTPPPPGEDDGQGRTTNKYYNQQFNITTQEIDPRKHAADLGWELAGRM